jgi:hypothetical protein
MVSCSLLFVKYTKVRETMKHLIGQGVLNWNRSERVSDRYGSVMLTRDAMTSPLSGNMGYAHISEEHEGKQGRLIAIVRESRLSPHVGDFFRGFCPPPEPTPVGTELVLGTGTVFVEDNEEGGACVGLSPDDERRSDWLDPRVLYQLHNQTVDLFFEEGEK